MLNRCIVIGSSMSMPSLELKYEDTYLFKLKQYFSDIEFIDKCRRSSSVQRLVSEGQNSLGFDLLEFYNPNFVILHLGATDAAPRLLPRKKTWTKFINLLPFSGIIYDFVRKTKGRTISCADLSPDAFYNCLEKYIKRAQNMGVIVFCIKIIHFGSKLVKASPHVNESFDLYNKQFEKLTNNFSNVKLINALPEMSISDIDQILQSDSMHLTSEGSLIVFENIKNAILNQYPCLKSDK